MLNFQENFFDNGAIPGLIITTPNILSLKSRMRFLLSGFYYSFEPLDHKQQDGLQHIAALTYDQFKYLAESNGYDLHQPVIAG